jgi:hypothetical protein
MGSHVPPFYLLWVKDSFGLALTFCWNTALLQKAVILNFSDSFISKLLSYYTASHRLQQYGSSGGENLESRRSRRCVTTKRRVEYSDLRDKHEKIGFRSHISRIINRFIVERTLLALEIQGMT